MVRRFAVLLCLLVFTSSSIVNFKNFKGEEKHKGICWVGGREPVTSTHFESVKEHHITWISQTPFGWQRKADSASIQFVTGTSNGKERGVMWGESDEGLIVTTRLAKQREIKTLLKPHLWVRGSWPGEIDMKSEGDWKLWFEEYEKFMLHYAQLAEQNHMEALCVGTELSKAVLKEKQWRALIAKIRKVYKGKLTYAANFYNEFERIQFWDALDFIGIQAYFPLTDQTDPDLKTLMNGWVKPMAALEKTARQFQKPIVFTEIGYRSTRDAAIEPWVWPQNLKDKAQPSEEVQAMCYEAFFRTVWNKPWMGGVYFWKWYPQGTNRLASIDFTPQGKRAQQILKTYFEN